MALTASKAADGKVVFLVEADDKQLNKDLDKITNTIKTKSKEWGSAAKGEASIAQVAFSGLLETVAALGEAFGKMVVQFISDGIELAASVKELDGTINAVFGDEGAKRIDDWSKTLISKYGLSELQAKKYAASIGLIAKQAGLADEEMVNFSASVAGMAADFAASIPGMSTDSAFNMILQAMNGKGTSLAKYGTGFDLGATAMKAYAEENGMKWSELSTEQMYNMRYEKLLNAMQSTGMVGGFAASHGGQQYADAVFSAAYDNLAIAVGKPIEEGISGLKTAAADFVAMLLGMEQPISGTVEEWAAYKETLQAGREELTKATDAAIESFAAQYGFTQDKFTPSELYGTYTEWAADQLFNRMRAGGLSEDQMKEFQYMYPMIAEMSSSITALSGEIYQADEAMQKLGERDRVAELNEKAKAEAQAYIDGLKEKYPLLSGEVSLYNNTLASLGASKPGGGSYTFIPKYATGLDFVPTDNYIASLHAGESILTAEEAKVWRSMKYGLGNVGIDYNTLGLTMRDNIRAGGNVYLDGQTVGRVISARQGDAYRAMERSGFQQ